MAESIRICDRWRLRRLDKWNMILEEWRLPMETNANRGNVGTEQGWYAVSGSSATGPFFGRLGDALVWLLDWRIHNDPGELPSVEAAVSEMRRIADELKGAVAP